MARAHGSSAPAKRQARVGLQLQKGKSAAVGVLLIPGVLLGHRILKIKRGKNVNKQETYLIMTKQHLLINETQTIDL